MKLPLRSSRLAGKYSRVDGIPFEMPVTTRSSPALMAAFPCDLQKAARLLPRELQPLRVWNRALLLISVIDYKQTTIGKYIEFSIGIPCTRGVVRAPRLLPLLLQRPFRAGQFVYDLPVSTEISVKGGKGIWGMPKHQASLDFRIGETTVASRYELDGQLMMDIEIERPRGPALPLRMRGVNYCTFRGMLMKSVIHFRAGAHLALPGRARATLTLGQTESMRRLAALEIDPKPMFTAFLPSVDGRLEDHIESWFVYDDELPAEAPGLETVVDLGLGEEWPEPPRREGDPLVGVEPRAV
jgi:hypothetical protein